MPSSRAEPMWSVYVLRTARGDLYTGISTDVARRLEAHARGRGARALRGRGPLELVYARSIGPHGLALSVEHAMKRLARGQKLALLARAPARRRLLAGLGLAHRRPRARRPAKVPPA